MLKRVVLLLCLSALAACHGGKPPASVPTVAAANPCDGKPAADPMIPMAVLLRDLGLITQDKLAALVHTRGWNCCQFPEVCGLWDCVGCSRCSPPP